METILLALVGLVLLVGIILLVGGAIWAERPLKDLRDAQDIDALRREVFDKRT